VGIICKCVLPAQLYYLQVCAACPTPRLIPKVSNTAHPGNNIHDSQPDATQCYRLLSVSVSGSGFGGLGVSMLTSSTRVRGFEPGRSRPIFQGRKKSSACLPSEGKQSRRSHVADLWHVKEPFIWCGTRQMTATFTGHFLPIVPPFSARSLSHRCRRGGSWWRKLELLNMGFVQ
jgi:hypothetical protein